MGRCFKNKFPDNRSAMLGLGRCHGLPGVKICRVIWSPCRFLEKCLGMSVEEWEKLSEDDKQRCIAK